MGAIWAPVITLSVGALSAAAAIVLRGPIGRALAEWIRGWSHNEQRWIEAKHGAPSGEVAELRADLDGVRRELAEVQERLDFAERLLTKRPGMERIGPGAG